MLLIPTRGSNVREIFALTMFVSGIILVLLLIVLLFFKLLENRALKNRINWITNELASHEKNENLKELEIAVIEYNPKLGEETCSVCGLIFKEIARVVQCSICEKLYHEEHFIEWLKENENCPYCRNLILPFD